VREWVTARHCIARVRRRVGGCCGRGRLPNTCGRSRDSSGSVHSPPHTRQQFAPLFGWRFLEHGAVDGAAAEGAGHKSTHSRRASSAAHDSMPSVSSNRPRISKRRLSGVRRMRSSARARATRPRTLRPASAIAVSYPAILSQRPSPAGISSHREHGSAPRYIMLSPQSSVSLVASRSYSHRKSTMEPPFPPPCP